MSEPRYLHAVPGDLVSFSLPNVTVTAGVDDDGQPYVTINTEDLEPQYTYDDATGLRGTASPYKAVQEAVGDRWVVRGPSSDVIVAEFNPVGANMHRRRALDYAAELNKAWPSECGMPIMQVMLNDVTIYADEGKDPIVDAARAIPSHPEIPEEFHDARELEN